LHSFFLPSRTIPSHRVINCFATYKEVDFPLRSSIILGGHPDHQEAQYGQLWVEPIFLLQRTSVLVVGTLPNLDAPTGR